MKAGIKESGAIALAYTVIGESHPSGERDKVPSVIPSARADLAQAKALIGTRIDHYEIEDLLGVGGMGAVYAARDLSLDRPVALKMLREVFRRPAHEDRLKREARAQAKLQSPHVVGIHYIGRTSFVPDGRSEPPVADSSEKGMLYFAMERLEGGSLEDVLERGETLDPETARRMMLQVTRGLRAAFRAGILHRDIKPSNLLRGRDGTVKIADFGLAKGVSAEESIHDGSLVGSPYYMSPEQCEGRALDHRADLYSLGATFYHLIAGHPPFEGESIMDVVTKHLSETPPPLDRTEVPPKLAKILMRLLAKDPDDRYPDHDALIDDLKAAAPQRNPFAGFWIRGTAVVLDTAVAGILIAGLGWLGMILHLLHVTAGHALRGQTLAKYLLKIQVRRADDGPVGWSRAFARTIVSLWMPLILGLSIFVSYGFDGLVTTIEQLRFGEAGRMQAVILSLALGNGLLSLLYGAGLVLAGFHPQKRSVHDLITGTVVRYKLPT